MDLLVPEVISLISKLGAMMVLIRAGFMSLWRSMRLCYPNPPFSQLARVLTKIALKGARVVLCTPVCNFLELGQFGSLNSKGVSKGCAWGLFGGNIV